MAFNSEYKISNDTKNVNSQCKIIHYGWKFTDLDSGTSNSTLSGSNRLDISSQILSASYTKNIGNPSGSFTIELGNSPGFGSGDWKDIMKRGDWVVIYMTQDGDLTMNPVVGPPLSRAQRKQEAKKIRCIGKIDRVAPKISITDKGAFEIRYFVYGRDFGAIYEDSSIWHNLFQYDKILLETIKTTKLNITGRVTIDEAIKLIHNLFFYPLNEPGTKGKVNDEKSLVSTALQFLLPKELVSDVGISLLGISGGDPYWGALPNTLNISKSYANVSISDPTSYLSGNPWEQLKQLSVPEFHELFCETTDDGIPTLVFRPIPWAINKSGYRTIGSFIKFYKNVDLVTVPAIDVIDGDVSEDEHNRYNSFLVTPSTSLINANDNISWLKGTRFPYHIQDSIKRHGFRPMHVTVDTLIKNESLADGEFNRSIGLEFNELLVDYWMHAVYSESGSVNKIGSNDIKIGKCLKFSDDTPYLNGKRYYIEGYTDTFQVDPEKGFGKWTQDVILTRGFEEQDLQSGGPFTDRDVVFNQQGEYTSSNDSSSGGN